MNNTTEDLNKAMGDFSERASELGKDWLKYQRKHLENWRGIVEKRGNDDRKLFRDWAKSWMQSGFDVLDSEHESIDEFYKTQLKLIDSYIESLEKTIDSDDQ